MPKEVSQDCTETSQRQIIPTLFERLTTGSSLSTEDASGTFKPKEHTRFSLQVYFEKLLFIRERWNLGLSKLQAVEKFHYL